MFSNIVQLNMHWPRTFPKQAKDLVKKLLQVCPQKRISSDEILQHPWFKICGVGEYRSQQKAVSKLLPVKAVDDKLSKLSTKVPVITKKDTEIMEASLIKPSTTPLMIKTQSASGSSQHVAGSF